MCERLNINRITWKTLADFHKQRNVGILICVLAVSFGNVEIRNLVGNLVDSISERASSDVNREVMVIAVLTILLLVCSAVKPYLLECQLADIRGLIYRRVADRLLWGSDISESSTGQISTFMDDAITIETAINRLFVRTIANLIWFLCAVVLLFSLHWSLPLIGGICAMLPILMVRLTGRRMAKAQKQYRDVLERTNEKLACGLNGLETIKAMRLERRMTGEVQQAFDELQEEKRKLAVISGVLSAPSLLSAFLTMFAVTLSAGYLTAEGQLSIGSFFVALSMIDYIVSPVMGVENDVTALKAAKAAMDHLNSFLGEEIPVKSAACAELVFHGFPVVRAEHLFYSYGRKDIFRDFSVSFLPGRINFLMGSIGSGKSTLVKLMLRQLPLQHGAIYLEEVNQKDGKIVRGGTEEIRAITGVMPQQLVLFEDSIMENVRLYCGDYTEKDVLAALEQAGLAEKLAELPEGLGTILRENGKPLSGGEKQRLVLARSILRGKKILILDEPTSALDSNSKKEIRSLLEDLAREHLVILITHDREIVREDDRIIWLHRSMNNGEKMENSENVTVKDGEEILPVSVCISQGGQEG